MEKEIIQLLLSTTDWSKRAKEFLKVIQEWIDIDEWLMLWWFCNAIETWRTAWKKESKIWLIQVICVQDNDSHRYIIPKEKEKSFFEMLEKSEEIDDYDIFETTFDKYRTWWSISIWPKLYANIE